MFIGLFLVFLSIVMVCYSKKKISTIFEYLGIPYGLPIPKNGSSVLTFQDGSPDNAFVTILRGQVIGKASWGIYKSTKYEFVKLNLHKIKTHVNL